MKNSSPAHVIFGTGVIGIALMRALQRRGEGVRMVNRSGHLPATADTGGAQSNLGDRVFPAALAGKTAQVLGDPDQPHSYTYTPDIGEALAVLGEHPDAPGEVWHLPNAEARTTRQIVETIYTLAGQPRTKLRSTPTLLLRALGLVNPTVRELVEMSYEFEEPFIVDSSKIEGRLGIKATPLERALAETLDSYRAGNQPDSGSG